MESYFLTFFFLHVGRLIGLSVLNRRCDVGVIFLSSDDSSQSSTTKNDHCTVHSAQYKEFVYEQRKTMEFHSRKKCHYETLGVAKDATLEEIKAAFRKLSLETHPDVAGASVSPDRFKSISHAASVLTNARLRELYDEKQRLSYSSHLSNHFTRSHNFHRHSNTDQQHVYRNANGSYNASTPWVIHLFRPRNLILGPILLYVGVSTIQYMFGIESSTIEMNKKLFTHDDKAPMVQAWLNPQSGQYETPAPWDPIYQQLQPELKYVPRNQVQSRSR